MTNPDDVTSSYVYDNVNRLIQMTQPDPDGAGPQSAPVSNYTYNANGNRVTETNPLGKVTTWAYDNLNRTTQITQPDPDGAGALTSPITKFAFDALSRRTSLTDPDNNVTSWAFDGLNRVTSETNSLSKVESFGYNAAGDVTSRTDRNGRVTNFSYDNLHRRTQEKWMSGSTVLNTFAYNFDSASQLTSASATGTQMTYTFDNLGRVLTSSNSGTTNIPTTVQTNVYDANSRRTQQTAIVSSVADYKNTWTWDNANRQTQVKQEGQTGGISVAAKRVDFTYNTGGMFTGIKRYNDLAGTQIVANTTFTYDSLARLTALDHKNASGGNLANYTWTFDNDRRITNFTNIDGYSNYTYDSNDQVTVVDHSYQTDETYTYDANGNRTNTGYTTGTNNRVTSDGTYNYTYDDEGNRISRTKISDSTKVEYTWDHRNRLTDVVFKTSGGTVTKKVQYQYDVFDRRIGKKIDADGNGTYESATYWVYDDAGKRDPNTGTSLDDIVLEFNDADGDGSGLATLTTRYLHGPQFDQVLASEATSGNVVTWALADNQGTVRDMVRYASGTTTVVNHRKFDAFGNLTAESDATVKFLHSYTGREWDADSGLYYYRARWYDAKIGRFISEDPMGFAAEDTNLNRYVGNSALNRRDPSGLRPPHATDRGIVTDNNGGWWLVDPNNGFPVCRPAPPIDIQVRTFIPDPEIMLFFEVFTLHGDGRGVSPTPNTTYRIYNGIEFDPSNTNIFTRHQGITESTMYFYHDIFERYLNYSPEFHSVGSHYPKSKIEKDGNVIHVTVENEGYIPRTFVLTVAAPAINYQLEGFLRPVPDGTVLGTFSFQHDGFPGYEVYVNGGLVHSFDPRENNQWVPSLYGNGEWKETFEIVMPSGWPQ